jgi:hypothetical protein
MTHKLYTKSHTSISGKFLPHQNLLPHNINISRFNPKNLRGLNVEKNRYKDTLNTKNTNKTAKKREKIKIFPNT